VRTAILLITFISFFFCNQPISAQPGNGPGNYTIKGKLIDDLSGSPVEFATVAVKKLRDSTLVSGAISDAAGNFIVEGLGPGGYMVEIAFIGYEKHTQRIIIKPPNAPAVSDMGTIRLKVSAQELESTEIIADKSFVMNQIDRKTYNTEQLTVAAGGNVTDILENIPSVEVDGDGNVLLRGNENVTILIDGRPSGLTGEGGKSLLESLPASVVEKIEVITNPSAKYDPDGISGIINIITKKNKLQGLTGNIGGNTSFDKGYGVNGSLNYKHSKWNLYSNYGYNYSIRNGISDSYRETFYNDVTSYLDQTGKNERKDKSYNIKAGADYSITEKKTISLSGLFTRGNETENEYVYYDNYGNPAEADSLYKRTTDSDSKNHSVDLELAYKQLLKREGEVLNLQANASFNTDNSNNLYHQLGYLSYDIPNDTLLPDLQKDHTHRDSRTYTLSADYELPIGKDKKIEAGYKSTFRSIDNDFNAYLYDENLGFSSDTTLSNQFIYNDGVHALYAQYRQSLGKFGFQAGLRSEYAQTKSELRNTNEEYAKDYFSIFPSAYVTWKPQQKVQLKASYSRRINRPRTQQLNPFSTYEDPLNIRTGNPYLNPEYTDSYETEGSLFLKKVSITATLYYRYTHDDIQRYRTFDPNTGIAVVTFENINSAQNYGLEVIINGNLYKWWTFTLSSNFYQNTIDASNIQSDLGSSDISMSGRIFTTVKLPDNFEFQASYSYRAPFDIPQGKIQQMEFANMAVSKKILHDKGVVTLRVSDPFNTQKFNISLIDQYYRQDFIRKHDSRTFTLGFTYRFGELKDRDQRQRNRQAPEEMQDIGF